MNYFRPDIKASVGNAGRDAVDSVLQVFDNLQVAGSVAVQGFQQHVLRQPLRDLRGGFRLDKRAVVSHNAKFKVSSSWPWPFRPCSRFTRKPYQDVSTRWPCHSLLSAGVVLITVGFAQGSSFRAAVMSVS